MRNYDAGSFLRCRPPSYESLEIVGARENNLKNLSLQIPLHTLNVVTGVSGSGKSTLAFDLVFAEGAAPIHGSRCRPVPSGKFVTSRLPRPDLDRLTGIPPTVAIEQRVTRGSRKSTVATITEVAQFLRLLYARLGIQHHPDTDRPVTPLSVGALRQLLARVQQTPAARRAKHLYLCAPLIRSRKGHHQPIAAWIARQGYTLMRVDGRLLRVEAFTKLDRYKEHDVEVIVADLKALPTSSAHAHRAKADRTPPAKSTRTQHSSRKSPRSRPGWPPCRHRASRRQPGHGACFLLTSGGEVLSWFSTTRTDAETGESFPELDPKNFSFNSPRGWCPACRGHGRIFPWMLEPEDEEDDPVARLRAFGIDATADVADEGQPCPECRGERPEPRRAGGEAPFSRR